MMNLTQRETEILNHLVKHPTQTAQELGGHFNISTGTVRTHLRNIYRKFDLSGHDSKRKLVEICGKRAKAISLSKGK